MKTMYSKFALGLMTVAVFCVSFALTLANPDEITTLAIVAGVSVGLSLWLLNWGEKQ